MLIARRCSDGVPRPFALNSNNNNVINDNDNDDASLSNASQWHYMSEGARNVVVRHESDGTVLRLGKVANGRQRTVLHSNDIFLERLLAHMGPTRYAIVGASVRVSPRFCTELDSRIRPLRPIARVGKSLDVDAIHALRLPNMAAGAVLCVELKPKWCFLPEGSDDAVKLRMCRFCMHQRLKLARGEVKRLSGYCPLALSSTDPATVRRALVALLHTPQNNLRLFVDGVVVGGGFVADDGFVNIAPSNTGDDVDDNDTSLTLRPVVHEALCSVFGEQKVGADATESASFLMNIVIETLLESAVLQDIRNVQRLGADVCAVMQRRDDAALLDHFMTSSVLKDCSVLLTFRQSDDSGANDSEFEPVRGSDGVMRRVAIVDLDQKAVEELERYYQLDRDIVANFEANHADLGDACAARTTESKR
jgi:hypothetical protein